MSLMFTAIPRESEYAPYAPDFKVLSRVPLGAEMLIEVSSLNLRIKCELVGMEEDHFIIVKIYPKDINGNFITEDIRESPCTVLFRHSDSLHRFKATILNMVMKPARLIFFGYPRKLENLRKVNKHRFRCALPTMSMFGTDIIELVTTDISKEGCRCRVKTSKAGDKKLYQAIEVDKIVELIVTPPDTGDPFKVTGFVRSTSKKTDEITFGVMFAGMARDARDKLDRLLV